MSDEFKPITAEDLKAISDHLRSITAPPPEPVLLTQAEWDILCSQIKPIQVEHPFIMGGLPVKIVTAEEREALLILKRLKIDTTWNTFT